MDKILITSSVAHDSPENGLIVTNDGATILRSIVVGNPAAKVLVNISKTQDSDSGDGTTSVCVMAGEFLRSAEKLIDKKFHPQTIIEGFRIAATTARKALLESSFDNKNDSKLLRSDLEKVARTILSSKIVNVDKEMFVQLAVNAVLRLNGDTNLDNIQIIKKVGGSISDSYLDEGFILEKTFGVGQPKSISNCKILLANTPLDTDKIKVLYFQFNFRFMVPALSPKVLLSKWQKFKVLNKQKLLKKSTKFWLINQPCSLIVN